MQMTKRGSVGLRVCPRPVKETLWNDSAEMLEQTFRDDPMSAFIPVGIARRFESLAMSREIF